MTTYHETRAARLWRYADAAARMFHTFGAVAVLAAIGALSLSMTDGGHALTLTVLALLAAPVAVLAAVTSATLDTLASEAAERADVVASGLR